MRRPTAGLWMLSLIVLTSCMEDFAKNGRIDKAVHKDVMEMLRKNCSERQIKQFCPVEDELSQECFDKCGGR
jgi:hypothetical protein